MYNPFTMFLAGANFSTYVVCNQGTYNYSDELKADTIYRVNRVNVIWSHYELFLQEIESGRRLQYSYDSKWFRPVRGYMGKIKKFPLPGPGNFVFIGDKQVDVTAVAVERVSDHIWNIISQDAIYTVLIELEY